MTPRTFRLRARRGAFTLVELLVATVVLLIILLMLVAMVNQTATIWRTSSAKVEQFRSARTAFESITRHLSQATLNPYYDYARNDLGEASKYIRQSDLRFVCGRYTDLAPNASQATAHDPQPAPGHAIFFNAPLGFVSNDSLTTDTGTGLSIYSGMSNLLNTWGYFVEYGSDYNFRPGFLNNGGGSFKAPPERYRYRLMEMMVPSDQITIYRYTSGDPSGKNPIAHYYDYNWFQDFLKLPTVAPQSTGAAGTTAQLRPAHLLAENIVGLIIYPQLSAADQKALQNPVPPNTAVDFSIAPGYTYDSTPKQGADPTKVTNPQTDPVNQLPPIVQVTLIAIDEASALHLESHKQDPTKPPSNFDDALKTKYFQAAPLAAPRPSDTTAQYDADLKNFQKSLVDQHLAYRIFTSNVSLRGAKWSRD